MIFQCDCFNAIDGNNPYTVEHFNTNFVDNFQEGHIAFLGSVPVEGEMTL